MSEGCKVAIVGGGTAGLSLAKALKTLGVSNVVVLEREESAGGVPRHCGHYPFGLREFKRLYKGPDYARRNVAEAVAAGVDIRTGTSVTKLHAGGKISLSSGGRAYDLRAERVVLCTGVREASRAQRMISGQRPLGVLTTGALQSMVFLHGQRPFRRPVIIGSELVALSAIMTSRHAGIKPVALLEESTRITARAIMRPFPALKGIPMHFGIKDLKIIGDTTVEAVQYRDATGQSREIITDGVILSGRFRPESALMFDSHLEVDPATGGPIIDQFGRCSDPSYFATGNVLRPVETSGWCWHEAVETATRLSHDLTRAAVSPPSVPLRVASPHLRYVVPQRLALSGDSGGMSEMQLRLNAPTEGYLTAMSAGKSLSSVFISARQERRLLAPLTPLVSAVPSAPVELDIF